MTSALQPKPAVYAIKETPEGFAVQRNGGTIKTPQGESLIVPTAALAEAIAEELRAGADFGAAPLMQMAASAIDSTATQRVRTLDEILSYSNSELLCHRSGGGSDLSQAEEKAWQPLLDWCAEEFDAPLKSAPGITTVKQAPESVAALRRAIDKYDCFRLTGLLEATRRSGSLVLGLALAEKRITPDEAFHAAELATTHQIKKYGDDPVLTAQRSAVHRDLCHCQRWFALIS